MEGLTDGEVQLPHPWPQRRSCCSAVAAAARQGPISYLLTGVFYLPWRPLPAPPPGSETAAALLAPPERRTVQMLRGGR